MTDADLARQVAECDDKIALKLHETGQLVTRIGDVLDAWGPIVVAQTIVLEALVAELAERDPEMIDRIADRVAPTVARYPDALRQAVAEMLRARRGN